MRCLRATAMLWLLIVVFGSVTSAAELPAELRAELQRTADALADQPVEAGIFSKGLKWALRYDKDFTPADLALLKNAVTRHAQRIAAEAITSKPWLKKRGKLALGYTSKVDGSVQPYGIIVPAGYDPAKPIRLDVVLHGSTRPVGMSELRFIARFDEGDAGGAAPAVSYIELHPLGRVENCYRWAGETDVFEAIEDVCQRYNIDRDRIVLRGMSMGASGTWHLGLKHPDKFVALGPYCGYVDTHRFSETPLPNFVKVGPLPPHQELGLHMLDSVDYAANAGVVPAIACMGEKDVFFDAHVIMGAAMEREGLKMINLISPGTGHTIDPVTHAEQMRQIAVHVERGLDHRPKQIRFVTWTLKYPHCHWVELLGLERHYTRAEIQLQFSESEAGLLAIPSVKNITAFRLRASQLPAPVKAVRFPTGLVPVMGDGDLIFANGDGGWRQVASRAEIAVPSRLGNKRPGVQGPIDDAYTTPFLCVRGTGTAWNPAVQAYADASLTRFAEEWRHYFRGELPIKVDTEVTDTDLRTKNLILFGDPGSNPWISLALPHLPVVWTRDTVQFGGQSYPASEHLPALIAPNPLVSAGDRYLVLNSGHTFREAELNKLNYLLFPRWGDWAILKVRPINAASSADLETVLSAGFFNEHWQPNDR